jgi:hypothetical protein
MSPENTVQVVCGVLALICVVVILMRRKGKKSQSQSDDF